MRILFDQGTPAPLRRHLGDHTFDTVGERGWSELGNGELIARAEDRHGVFKASSDGRRGLKVATQFARAMRELGITQVFARSPQAKGRVERAAGTFQDRLVTKLSDASASTIAEAQTVLERFLPRFNARFRVPAAEPEVAYRPLDRALPLASILGFRHPRSVARDNTVKYRWRTLQLLPGPERTSYAGAQVEVLERPGGELSVLHQGATIAPARGGASRRGAESGALRAGPAPGPLAGC